MQQAEHYYLSDTKKDFRIQYLSRHQIKLLTLLVLGVSGNRTSEAASAGFYIKITFHKWAGHSLALLHSSELLDDAESGPTVILL